MKKNLLALALALSLVLLYPGEALAYLDPGAGSMLVSALVGVSAALLFAMKNFWRRGTTLFYRLGRRAAPPARGKIVFYSEGRQYWPTFKPVLKALEDLGEPALYLASDHDDPGLALEWNHVSARHIGTGNRGFAVMNMLEADICVMTTPGLEVLQLRRSPGVKHYAHLIHAVTDVAFYKLYSFDYFDSVLCAGPQQIRSLRHLEQLRGFPPKLLLETGCCYMDALADELETAPPPSTQANTGEGEEARSLRLLLAPTWGVNGLLSRFGINLLLPLLQAGHSLCLRPHPQSFISEKSMLDSLKQELRPYSGVSWDTAISPLGAMLASDVLISDLSGIIFDYAFILERPALTVAFEPDKRGKEAADLPWKAWELEALPELGGNILPGDIPRLPEAIASLPGPELFIPRIRTLRSKSLFNFRRSGAVAASQLLTLHKTLREKQP